MEMETIKRTNMKSTLRRTNLRNPKEADEEEETVKAEEAEEVQISFLQQQSSSEPNSPNSISDSSYNYNHFRINFLERIR